MKYPSHELPSVWDEVGAFLDSANNLDWDTIVGEPPEWYYPLVGKVAVATAGLERRLAETALHLLQWPADSGGNVSFWLSSSTQLRTLLRAAPGLLPEFDQLAAELRTAWKQRNEVVHVSTGWDDWEAPEDPSGWYYEHPRSGQRVYLDEPSIKPQLERVLHGIAALDQRVWDLCQSLRQSRGMP